MSYPTQNNNNNNNHNNQDNYLQSSISLKIKESPQESNPIFFFSKENNTPTIGNENINRNNNNNNNNEEEDVDDILQINISKQPRATLEQRIMILDHYYKNGQSKHKTVNCFKDKVSISISTLSDWLKRESDLRSKYQFMLIQKNTAPITINMSKNNKEGSGLITNTTNKITKKKSSSAVNNNHNIIMAASTNNTSNSSTTTTTPNNSNENNDKLTPKTPNNINGLLSTTVKKPHKSKYEGINNMMDRMVEHRKIMNLPINETVLKEYWVECAKKCGITDPKRSKSPSNGWLDHFKNRHNLKANLSLVVNNCNNKSNDTLDNQEIITSNRKNINDSNKPLDRFENSSTNKFSNNSTTNFLISATNKDFSTTSLDNFFLNSSLDHYSNANTNTTTTTNNNNSTNNNNNNNTNNNNNNNNNNSNNNSNSHNNNNNTRKNVIITAPMTKSTSGNSNSAPNIATFNSLKPVSSQLLPPKINDFISHKFNDRSHSNNNTNSSISMSPTYMKPVFANSTLSTVDDTKKDDSNTRIKINELEFEKFMKCHATDFLQKNRKKYDKTLVLLNELIKVFELEKNLLVDRNLEKIFNSDEK
ncbi:DNA-binding domain-containing protein SCDLUD_001338 [Saccharomycodes ludwigii]|uniref:DNA-binding domain-containing protein n=1 Tax=Saccharomycodes ludwigii TaxID=36035 RepID=UPI001E894FA2|nr:hypothetical protein SCDLUD_001338 [Saccharomycodes ludwigii]KAH3901575.1 hypothetical protein SCDLUD_001338 [Saccharomycodes ludwigii]